MSTWQQKFRGELAERGYSLVTADHNTAHGWCVVFSDGLKDSSFEAKTTVAVSKKISKLKRKPEIST